ncbi:helicase POLQ-like isoform X2 [Amyelois transitella]|uniref:helicase POLQ-like isoform X2 n=1 Tax=Amyelois transitella TaxID=680683 RepID=UPI00298FB716|nr:helicase POLQ-like isoform X2 [Amyelois transitella]
MNSYNKFDVDNTSTPKRRRLGTSRVLCSRDIVNHSPIHRQISSTVISSSGRCESPPLPCNQVEYLNESEPTSIPCSPGIEGSIMKDVENWESLALTNFRKKNNVLHDTITEDDLSDDMFCSELEIKSSHDKLVSSNCQNHFKDIEETFDLVNKSICDIDNKVDKSSLFETKDSFLLDIKESGILVEEKCKSNEVNKHGRIDQKLCDGDTFYGLPLITKSLFKTFRNIEKFYDWQEECLNLDAIKERRNLIYALPTSGGKTLVAEVLMLNEVLNRKKNALFILPFVAIVQEKIWALSPFAVKLEFLVEEYTGGKGHIPPKKRRRKNSIYIATIEKGLALVRSLIELDRLQEIGLIVVDELHLIGEPGRGGTLETLLTTVIFANKGIQIVGMSATIGNLPSVAKFLRADVFQREFRPVELTEYVKLGDMLYRIEWGGGMELVPERQLAYDYVPAATALDPDWLGGLVSEVVPQASCLVFCPTKRNCENVASLLCKLQRREMTSHRTVERQALEAALVGEGASSALTRAVRFGVGFHHAGLAADERALLETAFRSGVVSVLCCTSTLAAGVNLPARRVIVRAPRVGREPLSLAAYRQMAGRAGRAGVSDAGESIIICSASEWPALRTVLAGPLRAARSRLRPPALLLSAAALRLAGTRAEAEELMATTFLALDPEINIKEECDASLRSLVQCGALEVSPASEHAPLTVSELGRAAIIGGLELPVAKQLVEELQAASRGVVLLGSLHLLFVLTPHDAPVSPDYRHYYSLYCNLDEEGLQTAKTLGITEMNAVRMMTGKPITNVSELVLRRFYLALMLRDLLNQVPSHVVADKYNISRGAVQSLLSGALSLCNSAVRLCGALFETAFETSLSVRYNISRGAVQSLLSGALSLCNSAVRLCGALFETAFETSLSVRYNISRGAVQSLLSGALSLCNSAVRLCGALFETAFETSLSVRYNISRGAVQSLLSGALSLCNSAVRLCGALFETAFETSLSVRYNISRGAVQSLLSGALSLCNSAVRLCGALFETAFETSLSVRYNISRGAVQSLLSGALSLCNSAVRLCGALFETAFETSLSVRYNISRGAVQSLLSGALSLCNSAVRLCGALFETAFETSLSVRYNISRGAVQSLLSGALSLCNSAVRLCGALFETAFETSLSVRYNISRGAVQSLLSGALSLCNSAVRLCGALFETAFETSLSVRYNISRGAVQSLLSGALSLCNSAVRLCGALFETAFETSLSVRYNISRGAVQSLLSGALSLCNSAVRLCGALFETAFETSLSVRYNISRGAVQSLLSGALSLCNSAVRLCGALFETAFETSLSVRYNISRGAVQSLLSGALSLCNSAVRLCGALFETAFETSLSVRYNISRGAVQSLLSGALSLCNSAVRLCGALFETAFETSLSVRYNISRGAVQSLLSGALSLCNSAVRLCGALFETAFETSLSVRYNISRGAVQSLLSGALSLCNSAVRLCGALFETAFETSLSVRYNISRGAVQSLLSGALSLCNSAVRLCGALPALCWWRALLAELAPRLQPWQPELIALMELPAVRKARAMQLLRAGYKRIEDLAKANADDLCSSVSHLSRTAASHLISAARMMLIEKVENLRAEAEEVMEDLSVLS